MHSKNSGFALALDIDTFSKVPSTHGVKQPNIYTRQNFNITKTFILFNARQCIAS